MFSNNNSGYSLADVAAVTRGGYDNDGFGGCGNGGWIWIFLIFALFGWGGFGGNGWGNNGNNVLPYLAMNGGFNSPAAQGYATRNDITESFITQGIDSGIRDLSSALCSSTASLNNAIQSGFNASNVATLQGFNAANITALQGFNGIESQLAATQAQMAQCCCDTRESIANLNYNLASQACDTRNTIQNAARDIIENQNNGTKAILDAMTQETIQDLRDQLQNAQFQLSQQTQTASLVNQLRPTPIPAYMTCSPYEASNAYALGYNAALNNNGNCGCGCGC